MAAAVTSAVAKAPVLPVLAAAFALAGAAKLARRPSRRLMPWIDDVGPRAVRLIAVAEIAGATALLLPPLRVLAAGCLGVLMAGGIGVHLRRRELLRCAPAAVLLGGCVAVLAHGREPAGPRGRSVRRPGEPGSTPRPR
jgi:hypothetical protein